MCFLIVLLIIAFQKVKEAKRGTFYSKLQLETIANFTIGEEEMISPRHSSRLQECIFQRAQKRNSLTVQCLGLQTFTAQHKFNPWLGNQDLTNHVVQPKKKKEHRKVPEIISRLSVQFSRSVVSNSLRPHELQHARPVHHQLSELTQTRVNRVGDAIQPSHPLSSPSPPAPNPSQHQGLFQRVNSLPEVAKVLEYRLF